MTESLPPVEHRAVLPVETLTLLQPQPGEVWVDATLGGGGHARLIAERIAPTGCLLALDQDAAQLERARQRLAGLPIRFVAANFDQLRTVLATQGVTQIHGLLADLGVCSEQLDDPARGLSFQQDGPLDMRLDTSVGATASDLLARLSERELADVIFRYGEERYSRRVARRIVEVRREQLPRTTSELADLVRRCVPRSRGHGIDPATRTFQALRIAVNDELGALERLLRLLPSVVRPGGRVGFISFHSLEDRLVKQALKDAAIWKPLSKKPVQASDEEVRSNPRSRSAKLRVAQRLGEVSGDRPSARR